MDWMQQHIVNILLFLFVLFLLWKRFLAPKFLGIKSISAADYHAFRKQDHTLIDVRSSAEWRSGHAAKAKHIELGSLQQQMQRIPKDKPVVLICASGNRSMMASVKLAKAGFKQVYNFSGGMGAWQAAGLPVQ